MDGRQYPCRIIDLSLSGAAMKIEVKPAVGIQVTLGTMRARWCASSRTALAIEFAVLQRPETARRRIWRLPLLKTNPGRNFWGAGAIGRPVLKPLRQALSLPGFCAPAHAILTKLVVYFILNSLTTSS